MQRLNSLSADARASLNYQEQLQKFHAQQGHARVSIPVVDRRPVDLYNLKLKVNDMGGYDIVAKGRRWAEVTRKLDYDEKDAGHLAAQIKAAYTRIILPFEKFLVANREANEIKRRTSSPEQNYMASASPHSSSSHGQAQTAPAHQTQFTSPGLESMEFDRSLDDLDGSKRRSTRKRFDPAKVSPPVGMSSRSKRNTSPDGKSRGVIQPGAEEQMCEICLRGDNGTAMLLCDDCNRGYHMFCLDPPLTTVPKSQWYCPPCLVGTGNDYGFDDGETHSLSSFWNRAESFRSAWWSQHSDHIWKPPTDQGDQSNGLSRPIAGTGLRVSEDDVEREFWNLVHNPDENIDVEYGADVHSTTHGSALPTLETCPLSPYSVDGWNLNNLPILPDSLLRYIKTDISGMTVPWIYVGMIFSTFCWHNEDHHTYSINYQHFGDTKTWYGVPGADAHLLEETLMSAAPDLFEQSPDLLFQLVTMMSPDKLKKRGVRVYACDQRANEFVVTYPKAYHAGFNHGFNLNEAVNFALPDWIDFSLESVRRYQKYNRFPVFSHDELVVTVYQHNQSVDTAMWLQAPMDEMVKREIEKRNELRRLVPNIREIVEEEDKPEAQYQCAHCNVFCYLGQIISEKAEGVACLDHGNEVCGIDSPTNWTLRTRFSDETLTVTLSKTIERAAIPTIWKSRLQKLIIASPRPSLRSLRGLLNEGEKIPFKMTEVYDLRGFVEKANRWVDESNKVTSRKHQKRSGVISKDSTTLSRRGKRLTNKPMEIEDDVDGLQDEPVEPEKVYSLLSEVELLPFDTPEIGSLRTVVNTMEEFNARTREIFRQIQAGLEPKLLECEEVLSLGTPLNIKLERLDDLQKYVGRRKWVDEVEDFREKFSNIEDMDSLIQEGMRLEVNKGDELMILLRERRDAGLEWKSKAEMILGLDNRAKGASKIKVKQEEADELLHASYTVAIDPDLHVKIEALLKHAREWSRQCEMLVRPPSEGKVDEMEAYNKYLEASRLLKHVEDSRLVIKDQNELNRRVAFRDEMERGLWQSLYRGNDRWEPTKVLEIANRIKAEYLDLMEECMSALNTVYIENPPSCICQTAKGDKGPSIKCTRCHKAYHTNCLSLDKKDARERDWECFVCKPEKLPKLVAQQEGKKTLQEMKDILSAKFSKQKEIDNLPSWPWGETPTFSHLRETVKIASRLARRIQNQSKASANELIETIKLLLHCPLRLSTDDSPKDPILPFVENFYKSHDLDANGLDFIREAPPVQTPPNAYQSLHIPPFRSASREIVSSPAPQGVSPLSFAHLPPPRHAFDSIPAFDSRGGDDSLHDVTMNSIVDYSDGEEATSHQVGSSRKGGRSSMTSEERKRKRGKRAKFVFEEEVGIFVPVHGERIYCLCHRPETGTMISCERCSLWFHNTCVHVTSEADLGDERWICPMCCVKTERKYPHAEVKVKAMGEIDPALWLDVRATLRSTRGPVNKMQQWTVEPQKRIALHLESFYPATLPTAQEAAAKRQKNNHDGSPVPRHVRGDSEGSVDTLPPNINALGSVARNTSWNDVKARVTPAHRTPLAEERQQIAAMEAKERHKAGMSNLYSRGVTDAMIQKWYVGWNGRDLVYPRKDRYGVFRELNLGPRIKLAANDPDGTRLITAMLEVEKRAKERDIPPSSPSRLDHRPMEMDAPPPRRDLGSGSHYAATPPPPPPPPQSGSSAVNPLPSRSRFAWQEPQSQQQQQQQLPPPPPPPQHLHSRPSPTNQFAQPLIPPYRSSNPPPPVLPPPLPSFTSRSSSSSDRRSPPPHGPQRPISIPQQQSSRYDNATRPIANNTITTTSSSSGGLPLLPSSSSSTTHARQSPHSSPYGTNQPLTHSPKTPILAHPLAAHSPSSASTPIPSSSSTQQQQQQLSSSTRANRVISATPSDKSLEDYRALARKMKPNATNEEIESMALHAMN